MRRYVITALMLVLTLSLLIFLMLRDNGSAIDPNGPGQNGGTNSAEEGSVVIPPAEAPPDANEGNTDIGESSDIVPSVPSPEPTPPEQDAEAILMAVGDIMMHMPQLPGSYDDDAKRYDFSPMFGSVKPILQESDWAMANLETPLSADGKYSGFPMFNAPHELSAALKDAGFTIVTNSNNHSLDRGAKGVERTLKFLRMQGLLTKGTATSEQESAEPLLVEQNGITLGVLAYTYGTNGIPVPKDQPYLVDLMDEERMVREIQALREQGADYIAVALHFGTEYQTQPNNEQKRIARRLIAEGADLIAGSHPHVLQPYETVEITDPDGSTRRGVIIYSMGNFISNQRGDTKDYGIIYRIHLHKAAGSSAVEPVEVTPIITWVHRYREKGRYQYRILPVEQTLKDRNNPLLTTADYKAMENNLRILQERLSTMLPPSADNAASPSNDG
jgi:poly-gamma-glutamate capsule biosynthesis protein CapA/YwtB (metallophosphatase superfamily)